MFKVVATVINLAIISYLLLSKRLFGLRGGAAAEERLRYAESGWDALDRSLPGDAHDPRHRSGQLQHPLHRLRPRA